MENNNQEQEQEQDPMIGTLIFDRYKLLKKLGAGSFGSIYSAEYEQKLYAIKLEEKKYGHNLLEHEAYIMSHLKSPALPEVKAFGYSTIHNILVMELMGKSLEDIFESFPTKKFSIRCVCNIGFQMIEILEYIHNKHIIHRDIKPDNFVTGLNEKRKYIYILDFGLSKKFRSSKTLKHYPVIKSKNLTGTARYASINALNGLTQSRRDDLEAVGYVIMYFLRGRLPWQGIPVKNKEERYKKIMEKKLATSAEELCKGFPKQFTDYINYTRGLQYEQDPDYDYLKNLFITTLNNEGFNIDCYYDWDKQTIQYSRNFMNNKNISSVSVNSNPTQQFGLKDNNNYSSINKKLNNNNLKENSNNLSTINNITSNNLYNTSLTNNGSSALFPNQFNKENNSLLQYQKNNNILENNKSNLNNKFPLQNNNMNNMGQNSLIYQKGMNGMNPRQEKENNCCIIF